MSWFVSEIQIFLNKLDFSNVLQTNYLAHLIWLNGSEELIYLNHEIGNIDNNKTCFSINYLAAVIRNLTWAIENTIYLFIEHLDLYPLNIGFILPNDICFTMSIGQTRMFWKIFKLFVKTREWVLDKHVTGIGQSWHNLISWLGLST